MTKAEPDALREAHKPLVAVLKRKNPMLEDLPNVEANSGDEHESSVDELRADSYFPRLRTHNQKIKVAAMQMALQKVWAHRS